MKIVEYGTRGSHWGAGDKYELVIHKGRGQLQLDEGQALQLVYMLLDHLHDENQ